ncbi:MAG: hypothetical protein Q8O94_01585 [bacterium]|nr:hypothetical protein [bacterium]
MGDAEKVEVEVVRVHESLAPDWVKKSWSGKRMPAVLMRSSIFVKTENGLKSLETDSPAAARWLREHLPRRTLFFVFKQEEVKILSP